MSEVHKLYETYKLFNNLFLDLEDINDEYSTRKYKREKVDIDTLLYEHNKSLSKSDTPIYKDNKQEQLDTIINLFKSWCLVQMDVNHVKFNDKTKEIKYSFYYRILQKLNGTRKERMQWINTFCDLFNNIMNRYTNLAKQDNNTRLGFK